jgi:hypothetical protein
MPNTFTEQTFRSTYKDDYRDSDNYHRILFNAGRALQARELTQLQTIIQSEITRFADNIFRKDGVPVSAGGVSINNNYPFIKISNDQNNSFDNVANLKGVTLTGQTSGIKVFIDQAVAAVNSDPDTIYVRYGEDSTTQSPATALNLARLVTPGEILTDGASINLTVQSTNTEANPAVGFGSSISVGDSQFYVQGHFVFAAKQTIFIHKYKRNLTVDIGFKVVQDIVTVSDTDALYDNQGAVPNRSAPGADRYRIRLILSRRDLIQDGDTFVYYCRVEGGNLTQQTVSSEGFNEVKNFVARRIKEINGDFIKQYWKLRVEPNGTNASTSLMLRIDPGTAYVDGKRVATTVTESIPIPKARDTILRDEEQIGIDYGNFYYWDSGVGMLDIDICEPVTLYAGFDGADSAIGTANIRALTEGTSALRVGGYTYTRQPLYKAHLFNINRSNFNYTLHDVKSVKSNANAHLINLVQAASNQGSILHEPKNNGLMFDTPLRRPKGFTDVTMTFMKKYSFTASGTTHTITLTDAGESFVNEADILVASATEFAPSGVSGSIQAGNKDIIFSGLSNAVGYEAIVFVRKTNAGVKTKTLTETTVTTSLDSDGFGVKFIPLNKSDIYSINRVRQNDSDGDDIFPYFMFDAGGRITHNDDGRLIWTGSGVDSENQNVFVRFKYFEHSTSGQFFAVNSYDGQLDYLDIPAQKLPDGGKVSLRDVIDFRPSTNGSGSFSSGTVCPLPIPTDTITTDAEYYLPRADRLVVSRDGELRYITGSSSLSPKYPDVPVDCIDLYKLRLEANTLHSQDLKMTLIPRKGYTMADINKIEEKVDRLEELTTLSLLELNTKYLSVLDSAGNERTKAGFFVDNFKNHSHSATKSIEYKAAIDKRGKLLRPSYVEDVVDLYYDSANASQLRTVIRDDFVMLDYYETTYETQDLASETENLAPFFVPVTIGNLTLSPETDSWKETDKIGETIVGTATEFDLTDALNWNNSENEWYGVDPSDLEVGDASASFASGTSTVVTHNALDPVLIGTETTETLGEWVKVGHVTDVETLYTETVEISRERKEEISRSAIDSFVGGIDWIGTNYGIDPVNGRYWHVGTGIGGSSIPNFLTYRWTVDEVTTDMWDVVTTETRDRVRTTNTSTYESTKTIETENTYQGTAEVITTTTTSNTVNRIASESTIRELVGNKVIDISVIPYMRSIEIYFKAEGLRPNTQYFPFFDRANVSSFCREETSFKNSNQARVLNASTNADGEGVQRTTQEHSKGKSNLITDAEGSLIGSFEVPNNVAMRFLTGERQFVLLDINSFNLSGALSVASANFHAKGVLERLEGEIRITRLLKVVGNESREVDRDVVTENTTWTETLIDTDVATDVRIANTVTTIVTANEPTKEFVGSEVTYELVSFEGVTPRPVAEGPPGSTNLGGFEDTPTTDVDDFTTARLEEMPAKSILGNGGQQRLPRVNRLFDYSDPLAQTFLITQNSGVFVTSVDVYFSSKSSSDAVFCELRPAVNGVPSASKIVAYKKLSPSQVTLVPDGSTNTQMLNYATKFTFDAPVFLDKGEYALVLRPGNNSPDYNVYVGTVGQHQLGSNEALISQQPTLGAFFKSQNGKLWEPSSNQDLAYRIHIAQFELSGNAILENANVNPVALSKDPLVVDSGSNTVRVMLKGHGLRDGDKTWIRGIDSATDFGNGLSGADVNGVRTVINYDNSGYTYAASSSANKRRWFGGSSVTSQRNINFEVLRPEIDVIQPGGTNLTFSAKTTTQQSLAGSETRYVKDAAFQIIENQKNNEFSSARAIYNRRNENLTGAGKLAGQRSATIQVSMTTTNPFVSPLIDLQRAKLDCIHNLISRQDSAATVGFNVPLTYISERHPSFGTESAKHVTKITTLTDEAVGLKILLAANRPPQADFQVYWRTAAASDNINQKVYTLVSPETNLPPDTNRNIFREYRYLVGGDGGTMDPFVQFQVKIVMRSTSSAKVPSFRDLRIITLAV